jgi:hypothetical protein
MEGGGDMKKPLRVFHVSGVGKMLVEGMADGTILRITDSDFLLATNRNRVLTTNWDRVLKEHIVPRHIVQQKAKAIDPRRFADFLLIMFLKPSHVASAIGDLKEHFDRDCRCLGRRRAIWLYWRRTFDSLWPLLRRAIGKALKWGAVIATLRRLF